MFCYDAVKFYSRANLIPGLWNPGRSSKKRGHGMRGDQLARQWQLIWSIKASSYEMKLVAIAKRKKPGITFRGLMVEHVHANVKAQRAPRNTYRGLSTFIEIFFLPSYFLNKNIKEFSQNRLQFLGLGIRGIPVNLFLLDRAKPTPLASIKRVFSQTSG